MLVTCCALTDPGCVRVENQDRVAICHEMGFFAIADGMGGPRNGAIAAELTLSTMRYYLECSSGRPDVTWPFGYNFSISLNANRLETAIRLANRHVWKRADERPDFGGMGSTIAAVLIDGGHAAVANVGDTRVYLYRSAVLGQLSTDDTWRNTVLADGLLDTEARERHPMRNVLTQAVGAQNELVVHTLDLEIEGGDCLLLTSDGLHSVTGNDAIGKALERGGAAEDVAARLVELARVGGAPDNVSCIVVSLASSPASVA
jgi:protein phosphatase